MIKTFLAKNIFLTNRLMQTFAKYERTKPHVNVGTIGHIDHGKTTLTSAITKYLAAKQRAKYVQYAKIDKAPQQKQRGITINTATLQYQTETRHYAHVDCPGHIDYVKNMITGAAKMDAGILVVAATDGPMPQTKQHVLLCRQIGVQQIIVFLNKMDLIKDTQMVDLIEQELKQLLKKHQYDPQKTRFVRGSALCYIQDTNPELGQQKLQQLLKAMDQTIPVSGRPIDKPFMMSVEGTYNIAGRGVVASGTIEQGKAKIGDQVQFYGYGTKIRSQIIGIQTFNKTLDYGEAGDNVGILVKGITRQQLHRGLIMAEPRTLTTSSVIQANIYCLTTEQGGRVNSFSSGYRPQLYYKTADTAAEICLPQGVKIAKPGDNLKIRARLNFPLTITKGSRFALREGGKTIAAGVVTQILPQNTVLDTGKVQKKKPTDAPKPTETKPAETKPGDKKAGDKKAGDKKAGDKKDQKKDDKAKQPAKDAAKSAPKGQTPPPKPSTTTTGSKVPPPPPKAGTTGTTGTKTPPPPPPKAGTTGTTGTKTPPPPPPKAGTTTTGTKTPPPPPPKSQTKTPPPPPKKK